MKLVQAPRTSAARSRRRVSRPTAAEWLDDLTLEGPRLHRALEELVWVNRFLGGHAALWRCIEPLIRRQGSLSILDVGSGLGDGACHLVSRAARRGKRVYVTAVDGNPAVSEAARRWIDTHLPDSLRDNVRVLTQNVWDLTDVERYDVVTASLFLHHFRAEEAVRLLAKLEKMGRLGLVVSDLHCHPLAYYGIRILSWALRASPYFRHDAALSVRRGYRRAELLEMARIAGLHPVTVQWHWAFRWTLSTIS